MSWHLGVDENGLGPQLGPLIVTGVLAELSQQAERLLVQSADRFIHGRLADSKQIVAHGHIAVAEAWARVVLERQNGVAPDSPDELLRSIDIDDEATTSEICPSGSKVQCWRPWSVPYRSGDEHVNDARRDLEKLDQLGVRVVGVKSVVVCVRRINLAKNQGLSRLDLDLRAMERLIVQARDEVGGEILASCGKVGGLQRYAAKFTALGGYPCTVLDEQRIRSAYRMAGVGEVRFLQDAENQHPLIALASLIGKAVRELWMDKIVDFYRQHDPGLPRASGYNDPVTERFIEQSAPLRRRLGIDGACFRRQQGRSAFRRS